MIRSCSTIGVLLVAGVLAVSVGTTEAQPDRGDSHAAAASEAAVTT